MKNKATWVLLALVVSAGATLKFTQTVSSSSIKSSVASPRAFTRAANPFFVTNLNVNRTDDDASATACAGGMNDCSLRGAIINANADMTATPVTINLLAGTTYNLTLTNGSQENAAATGDLDITTTLHAVTIAGGGSSTSINAAGLNTGSTRDRAFHITAAGATAIFQSLTIENGVAADDGTSGASTNPTAQNANRAGGGILNNGGSVTLTNVTIQSCQVVGKGDTVLNDHTSLSMRMVVA